MNANPYNYNPSPQNGSGTFGAVPGVITPPNPANDLAAQYPNLPGTNAALSGDILSKLSGQLSPATIQQLQNASATFGVNNGMPGSNAIPGTLPYSFNLESLGLNSEQQQQQGIQDYNSTIPTVSGTQTLSPALQTNIAETNALNASAPNPQASASYAEELYNQYLNQAKNKGGVGSSTVSGLGKGAGAAPTTVTTPNGNSGIGTPGQSGSFYGGQWFPTGLGPTQGLTAPQGSPGGNDPETGLPLNLNWDELMASFGQNQPQGSDFGSGE